MHEPAQEKVAWPDSLYDLQKWDHLSCPECAEIALLVEQRVAPAFRFVGIETCMAGTQHHQMARFTWQSKAEPESCSFMLIPGSVATLGYDRAYRPKPRAELMYEWWKPNADEDENEWDYARFRKIKALFYWGGNAPLNESARYIETPLNAFGLAMVTNSYFCEWCAESQIMRGGDGGVAACGGEGRLAGALSCASSYVHHIGSEEYYQIGSYYPGSVRRLYDLVCP